MEQGDFHSLVLHTPINNAYVPELERIAFTLFLQLFSNSITILPFVACSQIETNSRVGVLVKGHANFLLETIPFDLKSISVNCIIYHE